MSWVGVKAVVFRVRTLLMRVRESMVRDAVVAPTSCTVLLSSVMRVRVTLFSKSVSNWVLLRADMPSFKVVERDKVVVSAWRVRLRG